MAARLTTLSSGATGGGRDHAERLLIGLILAITVGICVPGAQSLVYVFERVEFYAHGYLMPVVAGYLAFLERGKIAAAMRDLRPPLFGAAAVFLVATFVLLSVMGDVRFAVGLGIPLIVGAVAYAVGGRALLQPLLLPLGFLALMVPPPGFLIDRLLVELKLLVTALSVEILYQTGSTLYAEGNRIQIPGHTLFVADACSGLTAIVTLLPVAVVVAYFVSRGFWRRAVVVLSVIPLAMAFNVARVVGTVKGVAWIGPEAAQGFLHESFGLTTYAVGTVLLVLIARLLR